MGETAGRTPEPTRPRTLQSHLLVLTLVTLAPMILVGMMAVALVGQRERAVFERGASERTLALSTALDTELMGYAHSLRLLGASPNVDAARLPAFYEEIARTLPTQPDWASVSLFLPSGQRLLDSSRPLGGTLPAIHERASFEEAVRSGEPTVGNLFEHGDRHQFTVRVPVVRDGRVAFVVSAMVEPRSILEILRHQRIPDDWVAVVVDGNHRFVARTMNADESVGQLASESLRRALGDGPEGWFHGETLEGAEVYTPFITSPFSRWSVAIGIPAAAVESGAARAMAMLALGVVVALLIALLLASVLGRRISEPIASLAAAATAIGSGVAVPPRDDGNVSEVRDVGRALAAAADAVREREQALRAADRAKDEYLAMLGHELRNPLSAVASAAHVLRVAGGDGPAGRASAVIVRQVEHMTRIIDDLLEVSRVTTGKMSLSRRPLDLAEIVTSVLATLRASGRCDAHDVRLEVEPVWVDADEARIEQIVTNLVVNALKFTPPPGRIDVRVQRRGEVAVLEVSDTGVGLSAELLPAVFDLFVQGDQALDRSAGGLGIGLTLVRRLAELHGGRATAASAGPGRGARFTVSLPAIEPVARSADGTPAVGAAPKRPRVLIVEDNVDAREAIEEALGLDGYEVVGAADGPAALALVDGVAAGTVPPDVVLIDIGLPGLDGFEVARRLRGGPHGERLLLIGLSGYGQAEARRRAADAGFDDYLTKPVAPDELMRVIESPRIARRPATMSTTPEAKKA